MRWARWQDSPDHEVAFDYYGLVDKRLPVTHLLGHRPRGRLPGPIGRLPDPVVLPHPNQTLTLTSPRPPRYDIGLTWKADVGPTWMHVFYRSERRRAPRNESVLPCYRSDPWRASYSGSIHPDDGSRRLRPVHGGGTRTYERYDETYADMFFAPRSLPFARPRSKALVGPIGQASPPWLRAKEAMHAKGFVQMGYGPSYNLGCDVPPLCSRRWLWPSLRADFWAWIVPLRGRPREMVAPLASALASPKDGAPIPSLLDAWRRALDAGRAFYLAIPTPDPSKAIKELLHTAWQKRPPRPQRVWPQWTQ